MADGSDVAAGIFTGVVLFFLVFVAAVFAGTIVWLIWPVAIPAVFPGLVASGAVAGKISWWAAVCFSWLCGLLLKASQTNTTKKE